jgi:hypothetical protein
MRGAGILAGRRLTLRPFCGVFGQGRAEQEQVAVGVDVRELAHLVVSIAWGPALPGAGRVELRAQLVGVLDRDVDPGSGAAGVVIRLEREVQRHAVPLADGEAGLGRRCGRPGRGEREPKPLVMLDRARHVGRRDARRDAEQAPECDKRGPYPCSECQDHCQSRYWTNESCRVQGWRSRIWAWSSGMGASPGMSSPGERLS